MISELITTPNFSFFFRFSGVFRIYLVASIMSIYGLVLYELFPQRIFDLSQSAYYYLTPLTVSMVVGVLLPKLMQKNTAFLKKKSASYDMQSIGSESFSEQSMSQVQMDVNEKPQPQNNDYTLQNDALNNPDTVNQNTSAPAELAAIDNTLIQQVVEEKIAPTSNEISKIKKELDVMKKNMSDISTTFESSVMDLKVFQAEITNPLNFMRKYFDSIDLNALKDSSDTPPTEKIANTSSPQVKERLQEFIINDLTPTHNQEVKEYTDIESGFDEVKNRLPFEQVFTGDLTLGKLMTIISLIGGILRTLGSDSVDLLVDQCKMMGLKSEDEHVIYNIVNMLRESEMSVDDTLITMYKFAHTLGIHDKEADAYYASMITDMARNDADVMEDRDETYRW